MLDNTAGSQLSKSKANGDTQQITNHWLFTRLGRFVFSKKTSWLRDINLVLPYSFNQL